MSHGRLCAFVAIDNRHERGASPWFEKRTIVLPIDGLLIDNVISVNGMDTWALSSHVAARSGSVSTPSG